MKNIKSRNKQSGVAIITAILIVSIAVVAAISIAENYELNFRRTVTAFNSGQAWSYAKGAEEWAKAILSRDQNDSAGYDGFDEPWWNNNEPLVFPLPNGYIEGKLEDAQGKLNVNNILNQDGSQNTIVYKQFERLFASLNVDSALVGAIKDWIDVDQDFTGSGGAEADIYTGLENAYLPADQPMEDISELRLVHGFDLDIYDLLLPHITNLNTASAPVLQSLDQNMPQGVGEELVSVREEEPFEQVSDFFRHPQLINIATLPANLAATAGVGSNYFLLNTTCVIGDSRVKMVSMIHRGGGNTLNIVKRSQDL